MLEKAKKNLSGLADKIRAMVYYFWTGVWEDRRKTVFTDIVKTLNLSVRSFMDRDLQKNSMSLTYSTVLALVPVMALLFAISRGFGFQNLVKSQLLSYFPAQQQALSTVLGFVDSYLSQASQGLFVGIGLIVLLWTVISLLSGIEDTFNSIWGITKGRSISQKVTDYIAICLMVPVLMICSAGLSIFMSTTIQTHLNLPFITPVVNIILESAPLVLVWLAFSLSYKLIPTAKVSFKYALIAGALCAIAYQILQLLFVNGQIYVSKYNAIYGSFAFLPLMLVWMQLSWLVLLSGCVITYSLQNVFSFDYLGDISKISHNYMRRISLIVTAIVIQRFQSEEKPVTLPDLSTYYGLPLRLTTYITERLRKCGIVYSVVTENNQKALAPAMEPSQLTIAELFRRLDSYGSKDFIPDFEKRYGTVSRLFDELMLESYKPEKDMLVADIKIPEPVITSTEDGNQGETADSQ